MTLTAGSFMKASMAAERAPTDMEPSSLTTCTPPRWMRHSIRSSIEVNCEKTIALPTGSRLPIIESSSMSASILVLERNCARLMRERIPRRERPVIDAPTTAAPAPPRQAAGVPNRAAAPSSRLSAASRSMVSSFQHLGHCARAPSASAPMNSAAHARQNACPHCAATLSTATSWQRRQTSSVLTALGAPPGCAAESALACSSSARAEWSTR